MTNKAPFLIFDELDHALDAKNMQSFVRAIGDLSQQSQVLFTSFRTEVLALENLQAFLLEMERAGPGGEKCSKVRHIGIKEAQDVLSDMK